VLATPSLAPRCTKVEHDQTPRTWNVPSDHVPEVVTIDG